MSRLKNILLSFALVLGVAAVAVPATAGAVTVQDDCSALTPDAQNTAVCGSGSDNVESAIKTIVNTLLFLLGAVSVVVIIIAGIMYSVSGGNANTVTRAKNMLLFAVVGLVVALAAYAIVNFVVSEIS